MEKPIKPEALAIKEARQMLINGVNYTIQETGISFHALEPIMKDIYNEVLANANKELADAEKKYQEEMAAYEAANTPAEEVDTPVEVLN